MQLLKVLVGWSFVLPAFAHHETTTLASSSIDGMTLALIAAFGVLAVITAIRWLPQLKRIKNSEQDK